MEFKPKGIIKKIYPPKSYKFSRSIQFEIYREYLEKDLGMKKKTDKKREDLVFFTQKLFKGLQGNFRHLFSDIYFRFTKEEESGCIVCRNDIPNTKNYKLNCDKWVNEYKSLSQLETGINMDKISMIYTGSNKNKNNNTSSFYDKDEEIKIHFLDDDKSIKYMKNKNNINNSRNNNNYMKNYNTISYNDNSKRNK